MKDDQPAFDAEQISPNRLKEVFRRPPGMRFYPPPRSTLLVGSRGSGKTMLLRTLRHDKDHFCIYGDLRKILTGVSADVGGGGMSFNYIRPSNEGFIMSKSVSLLGLWAACECLDRRIEVSSDLLAHIMPRGEAQDLAGKDDGIWDLRDLLPSLPLSRFRRDPPYEILCEFFDALTDRVRALGHSGLMLALDRAEEIPFPCLVPILRLLDQNHPFRTIIACRPGILGPSPELHSSIPRAGDHFDVFHLGHAPYSEEWIEFQRTVMSAWIPRTIDAMPEDILSELLKVSRDSLRVALELTYGSVDDQGNYSQAESMDTTMLLQQSLLNAAQGSLRAFTENIPSLLNKLREQMEYLPVLLVIKSGSKSTNRQLMLFGAGDARMTASTTEMIIRRGLRVWLFSVSNGMRWMPNVAIDKIELNPIHLWKPGIRWG
jgi:hypothetical protein